MTDIGFTRGPWKLWADGWPARPAKVVADLMCINGLSAHFTLAMVHAPGEAEIGYTDGALDAGVATANARLMSMAPDLYEALSELCAGRFDEVEAWEKAEAVLRKVREETP